MPFFQKLQDDLQAQIKQNNEQQEIITALVFRHLIENLPPNPYKGAKSATDRWLAFWEDAVKRECDEPTGHPLHGLVDANVFKKLQTPISNASGVLITRDSAGGIDSKGQKGQMYRLGTELFGILSKNIHAFEAKGGDGYKVGSHHWGKAIRDILERLKPVEYDPSDPGVVDWDKERKRYI